MNCASDTKSPAITALTPPNRLFFAEIPAAISRAVMVSPAAVAFKGVRIDLCIFGTASARCDAFRLLPNPR